MLTNRKTPTSVAAVVALLCAVASSGPVSAETLSGETLSRLALLDRTKVYWRTTEIAHVPRGSTCWNWALAGGLAGPDRNHSKWPDSAFDFLNENSDGSELAAGLRADVTSYRTKYKTAERTDALRDTAMKEMVKVLAAAWGLEPSAEPTDYKLYVTYLKTGHDSAGKPMSGWYPANWKHWWLEVKDAKEPRQWWVIEAVPAIKTVVSISAYRGPATRDTSTFGTAYVYIRSLNTTQAWGIEEILSGPSSRVTEPRDRGVEAGRD